MMREHCSRSPLPSNAAIERQLEKMISSPDFKATPQQTALLRYVVNQTLDGKAHRIKGYTVATEVLGRGSDFNQSIDPIVSIQAAQLRRALDHYYLAAGIHDPVHIEIPKGTYVPVFKTRVPTRPVNFSVARAKADGRMKQVWPQVYVRPLRNLSGDPDFDDWCAGMATEMACELNRYPDIWVMSPGDSRPKKSGDQCRARFVINGSVRRDRKSIKLTIALTDIRSGRQIWSSSHQTSRRAAAGITYQEEIARGAAVKIAGKCGWIIRTLEKEAKRQAPGITKTYMAVLQYYAYELNARPEALRQALAALEKAIDAGPEYGQLWSMRARLMADIHALDFWGFDRPLDQAFTFAHKGLRLLPTDQRAHSTMAYVCLLRGDLGAGRAAAEQALNLGSETLFELDTIGHLMTLLGDWERGPALIAKSIRRNPFYSNYVHYALWLDGLRQEDYLRAWQETLKLNRPAHLWDPLAKTATLGLLGRAEKGRRAAARLLRLRPDFPEHGRKLVRHLIKFDDLAAQVFDGLRAAGVEVA